MHSQGRRGVRHLALLAMFSALAMILSYVEILLPFSFGIPGVKLGIPNLITLLILYLEKGTGKNAALVRLTDAGIVLLIRIVVTGLLFTNVYAILYSLAGGLLSLVCMFLISLSDRIGIPGCSVLGGITHNLGQLTVAMFVVSQLKIWYYFPILLFFGTLTGFALGILAYMIISRRGVRDYYDRFFEG
ncbi:MAG: Gx transporter family protein [Lachnospiraceae bacterium]|nr:Gx transporter family protein [Lachnospiraceae bacterium]